MTLNYEKTINRIIPLHPDAVNKNWDDETIQHEAEQWCKPFFVVVHKCLDPKIRNPEQIEQCKLAPKHIEMCVKDVTADILRIAQAKKLNKI